MFWKNLTMGAALMSGASLHPSLFDVPARPAKPARPSLRDWVATLSRRAAARREERRTVTILERLDPHLRRDIGVTAKQIAGLHDERRPSALGLRSLG